MILSYILTYTPTPLLLSYCLKAVCVVYVCFKTYIKHTPTYTFRYRDAAKMAFLRSQSGVLTSSKRRYNILKTPY